MKAFTRIAVRSDNRLTLSQQISLLRSALIDSEQDKGWDFESGNAYATGYVESMLIDAILEISTKSELAELVAEVTRRRAKYEAESLAQKVVA